MKADSDLQLRLQRLHRRTDERFAATTSALPASIGCGRGCSDCCVDDLTVWQPEADRIAAWARSRAAHLVVGPPGACALLLDGRCQVYEARPYVCRSQGAVLRFWDDDGGEFRDTCPEHLEDVELQSLSDAALFDLGTAEQGLAIIATEALALAGGRGLPDRVSLRALAESLAAQGH